MKSVEEHNSYRFKIEELAFEYSLNKTTTCQDVNECLYSKYGSHSCHSSQECINTYGSYYCDCKTGFHFASDLCDTRVCQPNICTCQNGEPKTGIDCLTHGKEDCTPSGCNKGFHFDSGLCQPNICKCQNGKPKTGIDCLIHNKEDCLNCKKGYDLIDKNCVKRLLSLRKFKLE